MVVYTFEKECVISSRLYIDRYIFGEIVISEIHIYVVTDLLIRPIC